MNRYVIIRKSSDNVLPIEDKDVYFILEEKFKCDENDNNNFLLFIKMNKISNRWNRKHDEFEVSVYDQEDVIRIKVNSILVENKIIEEGNSEKLLLYFLKNEFKDYVNNIDKCETSFEIIEKINERCELLKKKLK